MNPTLGPYQIIQYIHGVRIVGPPIEQCNLSWDEAKEIQRVLNRSHDKRDFGRMKSFSGPDEPTELES